MRHEKHWGIEMITGEYEDRRVVVLERYSSNELANQRLQQLQAELEARGLHKPWSLDDDDSDDDEVEDDMFHGQLVDYTGAFLSVVVVTFTVLDALPE